MVKHIVLWKIRDDDQKQNNIDQMISMLTSLVGKIEGLVSMEMGYNFNTGSDYDVVLYATFKNAAALKYYQTHPEHIKCKDFVGSISVGRTAADYFYEEGTKASRPFDEVPDAPEEFDINAAVKAAMKMSEGTPPTISVPDFSIPNEPIAPVVPAAPVEPVAPVVPAAPVEPVAPVVPAVPVEPVAPVVPAVPVEPVVPVVPAAPVEPVAPVVPVTPPVEPVAPVVPVTPPVEPETPAPTAAPASNIKPENKKPKWSATPADFEPITSAPVTSSEPKTDRVETITEKKDIFGKKKLDVQVTPLDQRSDTWTCPNCGKIMPNYVGTCGCGEPKPFVFDEVPPAMQSAPAAKPAAPAAPAAPKAERVETITEKKDIFGKKKLDVQVTPLDQRSDTWTCPNCGKIMPNYVGTCGCGEPKPFVFDEVPPAMQSAPAAEPVAPVAPAAPKTERVETITEKKDIFGKKKLDVQVTPLDQRSDTWTCPNCGKIMPNYVGTCGCGEPKPFAFDIQPPAAPSNNMPKIKEAPEEEPAIIDTAEFMQAAPSIESYSPQTAKPEDKIPDPKLNYIKNDRAPDRNSPKPFGKTKTNDAVSMSDAPVSMNFDDVPPAAPMRFSDTPPAANNSPMDFSFDDAPPPAPMRFDDLPPAQPMRYSDAPPASPMKYEDTSKAAPQKNDKKHLFSTKKSREAETMRKAEEVVHNRKDIPNDGTWTCPNCGKVMPKYVGTCGCGESQPFDF